MASMLSLALTRPQDEYTLYAIAGLICLVAFVGLILAPALGSFGRIWEKAAAGLLSVFVLIALMAIGVAVGVVIVRYYNQITGIF